MSDQAPEPSRSGGNVFTRKIGPLPMWQWFLIALAMVGVYVLFQYRKNNQANANANNTAAGSSTGGTTGAGQVPQFVNQTNTYVAPPSAPQPPPNTTIRRPPPPPPARQPVPSPGTPPQTTVYNSSGGNAGPYYTGQAQLTFLKQNIGKYGLTASEVSDVQNAYNQAVTKYGQAGANQFHYAWYGPGNVQLQNPSSGS